MRSLSKDIHQPPPAVFSAYRSVYTGNMDAGSVKVVGDRAFPSSGLDRSALLVPKRHLFFDRHPDGDDLENEMMDWILAGGSKTGINSLHDDLVEHLMRGIDLTLPAIRVLVTRERNDLRGLILPPVELSQINFVDAYCQGMSLENVYLCASKFLRTSLVAANIRSALVEVTAFQETNLSHCDMQSSVLIGVKLANVSAAQAELTGISFRGGVIDQSEFTEASFTNAAIRGTHIVNTKMLKCDLSASHLDLVDVADTTFQESSMELSNIDSSTFYSCSFPRSSAVRLAASESKFIGCDFFEASFTAADLRGNDFSFSSFVAASLSWAECAKTIFVGADFDHTKVTATRFRNISKHPHGSVNLWRRTRSFLSFTQKSSSADLADVKNLDKVIGCREAYWPGPLAVHQSHNVTIPSKFSSQFKIILSVFASLATLAAITASIHTMVTS